MKDVMVKMKAKCPNCDKWFDFGFEDVFFDNYRDGYVEVYLDCKCPW